MPPAGTANAGSRRPLAVWAAPPDETADTVRQRFPLAFGGVSGMRGRHNGGEPGGQAGRQAQPS